MTKRFGWIRMPLGTEVGLGPDDIVLDGDPAPPPLKGAEQSRHHFSARRTLAHDPSQQLLSCCLFNSCRIT